MKKIQERLEAEGYRFNFFQAIKLLESLNEERPGVGHLGPVREEVLRLRPNEELSFSPADVHRIDAEAEEDGLKKWTLYANFLGLYGPNSSSPMYIAEMIAQCPRDSDPLRDFLDIFNHRILSLYYRAWKKNNLSASLTKDHRDAFSKILFAMLGQDIEAPVDDWTIPPERLLRYSTYFCANSRPACGLENLISDFFDLDDVDVIQFVPRRFAPPKSAISRLSNADDGGRLGESFVLGQTITDVSGQFRVRLGGLTMRQFLSFQPGNTQYDEMVFLVNMYVKHQLGFSLELLLKPNQGGPAKLSALDPVGKLGRSAWLGFPGEKETAVTFDVGYDVRNMA
jgi:type VI secretion system protein ImpH